MMYLIRVILIAGFFFSGYAQHPGHAHNDYQNDTPLNDALSLNYHSWEVDVYLHKDNQVKVSHWPLFIGGKPSLTELYILPLRDILKRDTSRWSPENPLVLMIDLKGKDKSKLISVVHADLRPIMKWIKRVGEEDRGLIKIVLSGNPPRTPLPFFNDDIFFIDGTINDLEEDYNPRISRVSADFSSHFDWKGKGTIKGIEKIKMQEMAAKAENLGYKLRFWNTPDNEVYWQTALDAGVDWMNTDQLKAFYQFYSSYKVD